VYLNHICGPSSRYVAPPRGAALAAFWYSYMLYVSAYYCNRAARELLIGSSSLRSSSGCLLVHILYFSCVLILLTTHVSSYRYTCVLILQHSNGAPPRWALLAAVRPKKKSASGCPRQKKENLQGDALMSLLPLHTYVRMHTTIHVFSY
jgi:hypothetical protein